MGDGSSLYTAPGTLQLLQGKQQRMAPHNPDLKLLVFWFWGTFKDNYPVYMSAKIRRIYVTFGLTSVYTHEEYLASDVNLT